MTPNRYDVAISFAGEDRALARQVAKALQKKGVHVFFDESAAGELWGQDLYQYLKKIFDESRLCVVIMSDHYRQGEWTRLEWEHLSAKARTQKSFAVFPVMVGSESAALPFDLQLHYSSTSEPEQIATEVVEKLQTLSEPESSEDAAVYHVIKREEGWSLKRSDASRATSVYNKQSEAIKEGKQLAKRHAPSELIVHHSDGTIASREKFELEGR